MENSNVKSNKGNVYLKFTLLDRYTILMTSFILFSYQLFFLLTHITGINQSSNLFLIYRALIFSIVLFMFFYTIIINGIIKYKEIFLILIILIMFVFIFYNAYFSNYKTSGSWDTFVEFTIRVIPSLILPIILWRLKKKNDHLFMTLFIKGLLMFLVSASLMNGIYALGNYFNGNIFYESTHGMTAALDYQGISYFSAFLIVTCVYLLMVNQDNRVVRKYILLISLLLNFFILIYSGGRGGFVTLVFVMVAHLFVRYKFSFKRILPIVTAILLIIVISRIFEDSVLIRGILRATEFIGTTNLINWGGTSGRDIVYQNSLILILDNPILGHGITNGFHYGIGSAHNIVLDLLIEGGILYLFAFSTVIIVVLKKYLTNKYDFFTYFGFLFFIFSLISLQFSFIYLRDQIFWFCIAFGVLSTTNMKENKGVIK